MRGEIVDFAALNMRNEQQIALGNARMNAKGDRVGDGGAVLKTQEQIEAEWAAQRARNQTFTADIKSEKPLAPTLAQSRVASPSVAVPTDTDFPSIQELVESGAIPVQPKKKSS